MVRLLLAAGQARQVLTAARNAAAKLGWNDRPGTADQVQQISELLGQSAQSTEET